MNFFKKLFSGAKQPKSAESAQPRIPDSFASEEYFNERYQEDTMDESMVEGTLKIVESYFIDNKLEAQVKDPVNHPKNLDQTIEDGFGMMLYCQAMGMEQGQALGLLALAFNQFMISNYGFRLYKDSQPEAPLRSMTLKYDKQGAMLSVYPLEYAAKVMEYEASFEDLHQKIKNAIKTMPTGDEALDQLKRESGEG